MESAQEEDRVTHTSAVLVRVIDCKHDDVPRSSPELSTEVAEGFDLRPTVEL